MRIKIILPRKAINEKSSSKAQALNKYNFDNTDAILRVGQLFITLYYKYKRDACFVNRSKILLGLDLLRDGIKRELLQTVTVTVEEQFLLALKMVQSGKIDDVNQEILLQILRTSTKRFLTQYYGYSIDVNPKVFTNSLYVRSLFEDFDLLIKVPLFSLIENKSPTFRTTFLPLYKKATNRILEILFDNLIINISEAIVRVILSDFLLVRNIQQNWFRSNFLSTRNLERFKNNLAWQDRKSTYIKRPTAIYNNEYETLILTSDGFYIQTIYANRVQQLLKLNRSSLAIINYVEFQDFLLCRVDETVFFVSQSTRYLLTSVIGQTIGLIWKGIIETLKE
jgi:hypothetical protein